MSFHDVPASNSRETGADTLGRFRYQAEIAALYALAMLDPACEYDCMYLEWHDDFLLVRKDGTLVPVQVKTREEHLEQVSLDEAMFMDALINAIELKDFWAKKSIGIHEFVFATHDKVSKQIHDATKPSDTNPFYNASDEWAKLWAHFEKHFIKKKENLTPDAVRQRQLELGKSLREVLQLLYIKPELPRLPDGLSRVRADLEVHLPHLLQRSSEECHRIATRLVDEILRRSSKRYDIAALVGLSRDEIAAKDALGLTRRLDAAEVIRLVEAELVSPRPSRRKRALATVKDLLGKLSPPVQDLLVSELAPSSALPLLKVETLAEELTTRPLADVIRALGEADAEVNALARTLSLLRLMSDDEADVVNSRLDVESAECLSAFTYGRHGHDTGAAFLEAARITRKQWRAVPLDPGLAELSDHSQENRFLSELKGRLNIKGPYKSFDESVKALHKFQNVRLVVLIDSLEHLVAVKRILTSLPPEMRALWVISGDSKVTDVNMPELPSIDTAAEDWFHGLSQ